MRTSGDYSYFRNYQNIYWDFSRLISRVPLHFITIIESYFKISSFVAITRDTTNV